MLWNAPEFLKSHCVHLHKKCAVCLVANEGMAYWLLVGNTGI